MKSATRLASSIAVAIVVATSVGAMAAELPSFAANGFPISPVQLQVVGAANVEEMSPVAADGLLASPHQLSVLAPHVKRTAAASVGEIGAVAR